MKVYIIGPMREQVGWNFEEFDQAAERLRQAGYHPFSPAPACWAMGYAPEPVQRSHTADRESLKHVMLSGLAAVYASEAVALLPGWEGSAGSTVEIALAQFLGLKILDAITLQEKEVRCKPWDLTTHFDREVIGNDSIQQQAKAWESMWKVLVELGIYQFFSGLGDNGSQRAEKFVRSLKATKDCPLCDGTGERATYYENGNLQYLGKCEGCNGTGKV